MVVLALSGKSRKTEGGGNITTTTGSPGLMLTPPPLRRTPIDVDFPPTDDFNRPISPSAIERTMEVSMSPLSGLAGDLQFAGGSRLVCLSQRESSYGASPWKTCSKATSG